MKLVTKVRSWVNDNPVVQNYREHGWKYFTPQRAWIWLRSKLRKLTGGYRLQEKHAIEFSEIITYKSLTCPDCVAAGQCRVCKCPVNELFTAMEAPCSDHKFPAFQETRNWQKIRLLLKRRMFKAAWREFTKKFPHWTETWAEYKEENDIQLMKFENEDELY